MKATFIKRTVDRVPEDTSMCFNGGDYYFHRDIYRLDDGRKFVLYRTSSEFDYCSIVGSFTKTCAMPLTIDGEEITVDGEPLYAWVAEWLARNEFVSPHMIDSTD